jgi:hypothetical protein
MPKKHKANDVMVIGPCKIVLPMRIDGNARIIMNSGNSMLVVLRGLPGLTKRCSSVMHIEDLVFTDYKSLVMMLNALLRYGYFIGVRMIRFYTSLPAETVNLIKTFGFQEEEPVSSLIRSLYYEY